MCSGCGQENRVPAARAAERAKCGACKQPLGPVSTPIDVGPSEFAEIVEEARVPVLVDFWASWCKPCEEQRVQLTQAAEALGERARILGIATSDERALAQAHVKEKATSYSNAYDEEGLVGRAYRIEQLPTVILIDQKGHVRGRYSEVLSKERIEEIVAQVEAK